MHPPVLGFSHFIQQADGVALGILGILGTFSVTSWYLIFSKGLRLRQLRQRSAAFLRAFSEHANVQAMAAEVARLPLDNPFARVLRRSLAAVRQLSHGGPAGLIEAGTPHEFVARAMKRAIDEEKASLEHGLSWLAIVASSAPFIGLVGTVWGIYHALLAIGASGQGTLDKVAGPVGEALIMTGVGLAVAIPASMAYNAFVRANRSTVSQLNLYADDLLAYLATGAPVQTGMNVPPDMSRAGAAVPAVAGV